MQSSQYRYDGASQVQPKFSHRLEMVALSILYVGLFSCLIRSDYNFPIIFFIYFIWQQRKDSLALKLMLGSIIILLIFDLIFMFTQIRVWVQEDVKNPIWNTLKPMHNFGIACYSIIMLLKLILMGFVIQGISNTNRAVHPV